MSDDDGDGVPLYSQNNRNFSNMLLRSRTADRTLEKELSLIKLRLASASESVR